jgi:ribonuclease HI
MLLASYPKLGLACLDRWSTETTGTFTSIQMAPPTPARAAAANAAQWKELLRLAHRTGKTVEMKWVKGHKKSEHNKAVDKLAKQSASVRTGRHLSPVKVRRKRTGASLERAACG